MLSRAAYRLIFNLVFFKDFFLFSQIFSFQSGNEIPCPFCRCPLDTFQKMLNHIRSRHAKLAKQQRKLCQTCRCCFPDSKALQHHSYRCKSKILCEFCGDEFILIKTLDAHLKKHHLDQVKKIWIHHCTFCLEPFPTNNQLLQHLKATHPDPSQRPSSIKCSCSDKEFSNLSSYCEHARTAHPEYVKDNWYTCNDCHIAYPKLEILERHFIVCTKKPEGPKGKIYFCYFSREMKVVNSQTV